MTDKPVEVETFFYSPRWSNTTVDLRTVEAINIETINGYWSPSYKVVAYIHGTEHSIYYGESYREAYKQYEELQEKWRKVNDG